MIIIVSFHAFYFKTFRLCQKFDKNCKYIYDPLFMRFYDYFLFVINFFVALDNNIPNVLITFFFNIITCFLLVILLYIYFKSNCINYVVCFKGFMITFFVLLICEYSFFGGAIKNKTIFCVYLISCLIGSSSFSFFLRNFKINYIVISSIKGEVESYKTTFDLLSEYYETNNFLFFFKKIIFSQKKIISYKSIDDLALDYLKKVSYSFKNSKDPSINGETNYLVILLNQLQIDWKNEYDYKNGKNKVPNHPDIMNVTCDTMYKEMNDSRLNYVISKYPEKNYEQKLINYCKDVRALQYGTDILLTEGFLYQITKLLLTSNNNDPTSVSVYDDNVVYSLLTQIFFIYRPLRTKFGNYYFQVVLEEKIKIVLFIFFRFY